MENEQTILEKITDEDQIIKHPETSVVDLYISGDLDGAREAIHARTVEIVSALVKKSKE